MGFELPPRSQVGYLDPEIAGEGEKVILSDGEQISWSPPPAKPVMPDWSGIKSIRKYFNRTGHQVWPAWVYHPTESPRLLRDANEAADLGICYRKATEDEGSRFGVKAVWDWKADCQWRPHPTGKAKFDPLNPGQGKTYVAAQVNPMHMQDQLVEKMLPLVAAAVVSAMKMEGTTGTPPKNVDKSRWDAFLQFEAWQRAQALVSDDGTDEGDEGAEVEQPASGGALKAVLSQSEEREVWAKEAEDLGIKVDGRWSIDRLKAEVEKSHKAA